MSSYRSHSKSGLPLWKKFSEEYPNGLRHIAFMTRLQGSRFVYQDDLGGLCSECNECEYEVFASINTIITAYLENESLKVLYSKIFIFRKI